MSRWAVILGVTGGTGSDTAMALAHQRGLHIFGAHRGNHPDVAAKVRRVVEAAGCTFHEHQADVGTWEGVETGVRALAEVAGAGGVAVFVHSLANASVGRFTDTPEVPGFRRDQYERTFASMAHAFPWWVADMHRKGLLQPEGALMLGLTNALHDQIMHQTGMVAATKGALEMYVRQLAAELGPQGHRVNLLKFGTVLTPALTRVLPEEALAALEARHRAMNLTGRLCTTVEVASFIATLTDSSCGWFQGATIDFTGGMTLRLLDLVIHGGVER